MGLMNPPVKTGGYSIYSTEIKRNLKNFATSRLCEIKIKHLPINNWLKIRKFRTYLNKFKTLNLKK